MGTVIFLSIALWVVVAGRSEIHTLVGVERVHRIVQPWVERWSQSPGPPRVYNEQAFRSAIAGDVDEAARLTSMSLALDPEQVGIWARMVCLSSVVVPGPYTIEKLELDPLIQLLQGTELEPDAVALASQWSSVEYGLGGSGAEPHEFLHRCLEASVGGPL